MNEKDKNKPAMPINTAKPEAVTIGWDGKPHLCDNAGRILFLNAERFIWPEYWGNSDDWPVDPETGERLPIFCP